MCVCVCEGGRGGCGFVRVDMCVCVCVCARVCFFARVFVYLSMVKSFEVVGRVPFKLLEFRVRRKVRITIRTEVRSCEPVRHSTRAFCSMSQHT